MTISVRGAFGGADYPSTGTILHAGSQPTRLKPETYTKGDQGPRLSATFEAQQGAPEGNAYQWDAVFSDGYLYKSCLLGQGLYVSPETDSAVIWFSTSWMNANPGPAYARQIVQDLFRD